MRTPRFVGALVVLATVHVQPVVGWQLNLSFDPAVLIDTSQPPSSTSARADTIAVLLTARENQDPFPVSDWGAVSGLARGRRVTVYLRDKSSVTGAIDAVGPDSISLLLSSRDRRTIPRAEASRVAIVAIRRSTRSMLIGFAVGAAAGTAGFYLLDKHVLEKRGLGGGTAGQVLLGVLIGGGAGASIASAAFKEHSEIVIYEAAP
jgi:hypothetical protein